MKVVNIGEAKAQFSRLLRRVAAGEEITITNRGIPVARLVPLSAPKPKRRLGIFGDKIKISDDFNAPLPEDISDLFEGKDTQARKKA